MKKHIPNLLTSLNLFSGCIAIVLAFHGAYLWVVVWVLIAALFDFSDGFAARLLKAHSPIGKELDSLADVISFGIAPSAILYKFLTVYVILITSNELLRTILPFAAFLLAVFSALRLAKFNIDERQSESFIGLNTPANALFWVSLCYGLSNAVTFLNAGIIYTLFFGIILFSMLMVSEIPMFSLKIKSLKFKGNELRYLLVIFAAAMIICFGIIGISVSILFYIALSIIDSRQK